MPCLFFVPFYTSVQPKALIAVGDEKADLALPKGQYYQ